MTNINESMQSYASHNHVRKSIYIYTDVNSEHLNHDPPLLWLDYRVKNIHIVTLRLYKLLFTPTNKPSPINNTLLAVVIVLDTPNSMMIL
jgi:hypothetical protein